MTELDIPTHVLCPFMFCFFFIFSFIFISFILCLFLSFLLITCRGVKCRFNNYHHHLLIQYFTIISVLGIKGTNNFHIDSYSQVTNYQYFQGSTYHHIVSIYQWDILHVNLLNGVFPLSQNSEFLQVNSFG